MSCDVSIEEILDHAAKIGVQAKLDGVARAQLEGILASLDFIEDPRASLLVTAAYAHRQAARLRGRKMANLINKALTDLYNKGCGKGEARRLLGLAKWVYESVETIRLPRINVDGLTFEQLLTILRGESS